MINLSTFRECRNSNPGQLGLGANMLTIVLSCLPMVQKVSVGWMFWRPVSSSRVWKIVFETDFFPAFDSLFVFSLNLNEIFLTSFQIYIFFANENLLCIFYSISKFQTDEKDLERIMKKRKGIFLIWWKNSSLKRTDMKSCKQQRYHLI